MKRVDNVVEGKTFYVFLGVLLLGVALRLFHINFQSLWLDELYSIIPTDPQNSFDSIIESCKGDQPPFFFLYIHYIFKLTTYNESVARLACAFIGVLGILAAYFLGKECLGKRVGLLASFLTALNYFHIYYSQEVRFYGMAFLFSTLSYLFFFRAFKRNRAIDFFWYALFTICLLYTHYFGLIVFAIQGLSFFLLLFYKRDLKFVLQAVLSGIVIVVAFIPWLPVIMNDVGADLGWIKRPDHLFVAQYFYDYTGKDAITTIVFLVFVYLFARQMGDGSIEKDDKLVFVLIIIWICLSYLVPYLRSILVSPILNNRYTIVTLPAWIIMFAIGWDRINNQRWKYAIPAILIFAFTVNMLFFKKHYTRIQKSQFREASEIVLSDKELHYPIYSSLSWFFNYYFRKSEMTVLALNDDVKNVDKFWLLQAHYSPEEMDAEIRNLGAEFTVLETVPLHEARVVLLSKK